MSPAVAVPSMRAALAAATARLAGAGIDTPRVDAEWLLAGILGVGRAALGARLAAGLTPAVAGRFEAAVGRRARREPLQHILGWEDFCGLRLAVTPDVLVPRPETETLVERALALLPPAGAIARRVIDVGTGAGGIACALAAARRDVRVVAVDLSEAASRLARRNVRAVGVADRVFVVVGDLFAGLGPTRSDLIVSNPPYLPSAMLAGLAPEVAKHDPRLALDGGADGMHLIRRLVSEAPARLAPGGALALETAGGDQAPDVAALMREAGFVDVTLHLDLTGAQRFVTGVNARPGKPPPPLLGGPAPERAVEAPSNVCPLGS
ncbi:MAG TPA: peptide chain release factor N(5)-glutamine methyltransferase [Methylomirabilota bacterium]|nr:peptide chain release factor N(5)-glutamine methyltransferase [Methylomirabilota bacterium]